MFCEWCKSRKCENTFTAGTNNFKLSTLTLHIETTVHQSTLNAKDEGDDTILQFLKEINLYTKIYFYNIRDLH